MSGLGCDGEAAAPVELEYPTRGVGAQPDGRPLLSETMGPMTARYLEPLGPGRIQELLQEDASPEQSL